jgi:hypothetical protein
MTIYPKLSPAALARCRKLRVLITQYSTGEKFWLLEVIDQRFNDKVVTRFSARTEIDYLRVRRTYVQRYRVPLENIEILNATQDTPEPKKESQDVNTDHRRTPKVHEPRRAVLVFKTAPTD